MTGLGQQRKAGIVRFFFRCAPRADLRVIAVRLPSSMLFGHWLATPK
jgi:hypothetical protein